MKTASPKPISPRTADALRWTGLLLGLTSVILRAMTPISPLPYWDLDPLIYPTAMTGLGPGGSLLLDSIIVIGAAIILVAELLAGRRLSLTCVILALAGAFRAMLPGDSGPAFVGTSWASGMILAAALLHLCRDDRFRIALLACLVGYVMVLAVRGAQQVFIEHPQTVADFHKTQDAFFTAQGWAPDSPMARAYIRRLEQTEATGWFGLANVYASFAAAGVVALAGLVATGIVTLRTARPRAPAPLILLCLALALSAAALYFAGGKGGYLAALLGLAAAAALALFSRPRSLPLPPPAGEVAESSRPERVILLLATLLGPALVAATFALVLLNSLLGERAELSLLFRFHYLQAAARIFAAHPITGVGPDGFQQAYLLAKNPLNPEEVTSPHNILAEWPATLGIFGFAWVTLWLIAVALCGRAALQLPPSETAAPTPPSIRTPFRAVAAIGAIATLAAAYLEQAAATPDSALVRLIGLLLWCAGGWAVLRIAHTATSTLWRCALAGAAIALACHSLIDVTASWPASAGLYLAMLGAAAPQRVVDPPRLPSMARIVVVMALLGALVIAAERDTGFVPALRWERHLAAAATDVRPLAQLSQESREAQAAILSGAASPSEALRTLAASVSAAVGRQVGPDPASIERAMVELELRLIPRAITRLDEAIAIFPRQWKIQREAARLSLRLAERSRAIEPDNRAATDRHLDAALARVRPILSREDSSAPELAWAALALQSANALRHDPDLLTDAAYALERAAALDPHGLEYPKRLMRLCSQLNQPEKVALWARRTLEVNALMRLDPEVKGLTEFERAEAARLAGQP